MNSKLYVAHVGDSSVVIGEHDAAIDTKWTAKCITEVRCKQSLLVTDLDRLVPFLVFCCTVISVMT